MTHRVERALIDVVLSLVPRCIVCGSPHVDATDGSNRRGLKVCVGHDCPCNGNTGDERTELRPTAAGLAVADAVRTLAAFLRGELG